MSAFMHTHVSICWSCGVVLSKSFSLSRIVLPGEHDFDVYVFVVCSRECVNIWVYMYSSSWKPEHIYMCIDLCVLHPYAQKSVVAVIA